MKWFLRHLLIVRLNVPWACSRKDILLTVLLTKFLLEKFMMRLLLLLGTTIHQKVILGWHGGAVHCWKCHLLLLYLGS